MENQYHAQKFTSATDPFNGQSIYLLLQKHEQRIKQLEDRVQSLELIDPTNVNNLYKHLIDGSDEDMLFPTPYHELDPLELDPLENELKSRFPSVISNTFIELNPKKAQYTRDELLAFQAPIISNDKLLNFYQSIEIRDRNFQTKSPNLHVMLSNDYEHSHSENTNSFNLGKTSFENSDDKGTADTKKSFRQALQEYNSYDGKIGGKHVNQSKQKRGNHRVVSRVVTLRKSFDKSDDSSRKGADSETHQNQRVKMMYGLLVEAPDSDRDTP
jgi:hypothetical protein